jgi:hypothetical protein
MLDVGISISALWYAVADAAVRVLLFVGGLAIAVHYLLMANFMARAPHSIKAIALPAITASGVGMAACALSGALHMGLLFGTLAAGVMVGVNLAAWAAGAYVSNQFQRAAEVRDQIKRDGWAFVRSYDQLADAARVLDTDHAPLPDPQRQTERQP